MQFSRKNVSVITIILVVVFTIACAFSVSKLKFDYDFEAFFPNEDSELSQYQKFRSTFEHDNEFVLLGIENKEGIFRQDFLKKINELQTQLKKIQHVEQVVCPTQLKNVLIGELGPIETPLLHYNNPEYYKIDSTSIYSSGEYVGSFFAKNGKSLCIYIKTADQLSKIKSDSLTKRIERLYSVFAFDEVHFIGRIVAQNVYLQLIQHEFLLFILVSFFLVMLFLYFSFRSIYGILVPISIVTLAIFWTLGIMSMLGKPIDIMSIMLPTMIFIAGMSDVVHYFSKYFEEINKGNNKNEIHRLILKEVGFPTFLTLITTVVGFLSLLFSSIKPIQDFGIYTSVGIVIAFILSYTLLPSLLYFFTPKKLVLLHNENNKTYSRMRNILFWIFRNQKTILIITSVTLLLSFWGITKIKVNNILLEDLREDVKVKRDYNYFDEYYSGARPFELSISLLDSTKKITDYEVMLQINKVDEYLKNDYKTGFMFSPAMLCKSINKALNNGDPLYYKFPDEETYNNEIKKYFLNNKYNKNIKKFITPDHKSARISGKIKDLGSLKIKNLNEAFYGFVAKNIRSDLMQLHITGAATLIDKNNEYMVYNMIQGFAWSILIIALLTYFLHRSWRMVLVFLLPNFIPMIIIAGFMGFVGIELKASTSLIFSIAFGIATDDTIHFISRLKIETAYGKSLLYAFKRTYFETGKPIILTTFILFGGFMSLMLSDFESTFLFGFLICIIIVVALIAELFLLPILLLMILGKHEQKIRDNKYS